MSILYESLSHINHSHVVDSWDGLIHIDVNFSNLRQTLFKPFYLCVDVLFGTGEMAIHLYFGSVEAVFDSLSSGIDILKGLDFGCLDLRAPKLQSLGYTLIVVALANLLYELFDCHSFVVRVRLNTAMSAEKTFSDAARLQTEKVDRLAARRMHGTVHL
jgi:hypothetical protein